MKKKNFLSVALLIVSMLVFVPLSTAVPPIDNPGGGTGGGGGGTGGGSTSYVTDYILVDEVLRVNGISTSVNWQFVSASAISPYGTCTVQRVNHPVFKVTISGSDAEPTYDFFLVLTINGVTREYRAIVVDGRTVAD